MNHHYYQKQQSPRKPSPDDENSKSDNKQPINIMTPHPRSIQEHGAHDNEQESLLNERSKPSQEPQPQSSNHHATTIEDSNKSRRIFFFYLFLCFSTALRNVEAGIVSSCMSQIQSDLDLDYTQEGTLTASPDFGLVPGALISIWVFRRYKQQEYHVLVILLWLAAFVAVAVAWRPTFVLLLTARALGGVTWAQAAVHIPVWIDQRAPAHQRTVWLACTNLSILVGVLLGYIVGGLSSSRISWVQLYFGTGVCMAVCAVVLMVGFDAEVVHADETESTKTSTTTTKSHPEEPSTAATIGTDEEELDSYQQSQLTCVATKDNHHPHYSPQHNNNTTIHNHTSVSNVLGHLAHSMPFCLAVAISGCISGAMVFCLYFAAQVAEARGMSTSTTLVLILVVFVTAPPPGLYFGSWIVVHGAGRDGYRDHVVTFGMALGSAVLALVAALLMPWSYHQFSETYPQVATILFVVSFWIFCFAGAMAGPPLNGVAVSAVPHATHVASAVQFAFANAAKMVVPQWGGVYCNRMGLLPGFHATLIVTSLVFVVLSGTGLLHAQRQRRRIQEQ